MAYRERCICAYQISEEFSGLVLNPLTFPQGLSFFEQYSLLSVVKPDRCCKSFGWDSHAPPTPLLNPNPSSTSLSSYDSRDTSCSLQCLVLLCTLFPPPFSSTQLSSFLVKPDKQVVHNYLMNQIFHLCSAYCHSQTFKCPTLNVGSVLPPLL